MVSSSSGGNRKDTGILGSRESYLGTSRGCKKMSTDALIYSDHRSDSIVVFELSNILGSMTPFLYYAPTCGEHVSLGPIYP